MRDKANKFACRMRSLKKKVTCVFDVVRGGGKTNCILMGIADSETYMAIISHTIWIQKGTSLKDCLEKLRLGRGSY